MSSPVILRRAIYLGGAALMAACTSATETQPQALVITPDQQAYAPGAAMTLSLHNTSDRQIAYNLCVHDVQRSGGSGWVTVDHYPVPGAACTEELRILLAGETAQVSVQLPSEVAEGTYRVRFDDIGLYPGGRLSESDRATEPFQVSAQAKAE
jgi:hypothetical protein